MLIRARRFAVAAVMWSHPCSCWESRGTVEACSHGHGEAWEVRGSSWMGGFSASKRKSRLGWMRVLKKGNCCGRAE
jgi:hypothetical protein